MIEELWDVFQFIKSLLINFFLFFFLYLYKNQFVSYTVNFHKQRRKILAYGRQDQAYYYGPQQLCPIINLYSTIDYSCVDCGRRTSECACGGIEYLEFNKQGDSVEFEELIVGPRLNGEEGTNPTCASWNHYPDESKAERYFHSACFRSVGQCRMGRA